MREPKYNFQGAFATALLRGGRKPLTTKGTKVHEVPWSLFARLSPSTAAFPL
jgi:hypothetical protein